LLRQVERTQQRFKLASRALTSLSPLATLERGYAIVTQADGKVLTDSGAVARGAAIDVRLARGGLTATVDKIKPPKN
jgi:exodeoxyribonuclease VII large subunit